MRFRTRRRHNIAVQKQKARSLKLRNFCIHTAAGLALSACASGPAAPGPTAGLSPAAALVQRQLDAYNARDLDGFIATYSPDIEIFGLPDASAPQMSGLDAMRNVYSRMFEELPDLHCDLGARIAEGDFIVDHEICLFGEPDEEPTRALAIYQVEGDLIRRVWFTPEN